MAIIAKIDESPNVKFVNFNTWIYNTPASISSNKLTSQALNNPDHSRESTILNEYFSKPLFEIFFLKQKLISFNRIYVPNVIPIALIMPPALCKNSPEKSLSKKLAGEYKS